MVGKAGPGTIAEATCCGAPLVLTSFVPGQEKGNAEFVTGAGAGVYAPRPRQLAAEIGRLRRDPGALAAMREASVRVGRPRAATDIARFLAELAGLASAGRARRPAPMPPTVPPASAPASPASAHCSPPSSAARSRRKALSSCP